MLEGGVVPEGDKVPPGAVLPEVAPPDVAPLPAAGEVLMPCAALCIRAALPATTSGKAGAGMAADAVFSASGAVSQAAIT